MLSLIRKNELNDIIQTVGSLGSIWDHIHNDPVYFNSYHETETAKVFEIELPRYSKDQIDISLSEGYLYIAADNGKNKFNTSVSLPMNVDLNATAKLENGVLTVSFPKKTKTSTKIKIE